MVLFDPVEKKLLEELLSVKGGYLIDSLHGFTSRVYPNAVLNPSQMTRVSRAIRDLKDKCLVENGNKRPIVQILRHDSGSYTMELKVQKKELKELLAEKEKEE